MSYRPNILALDLSIAATGVAFPDGTLDTIHTSSADTDDHRVDEIAEAITYALATPTVDLVVMEGGVFLSQAAFRLGMVHRAARVVVREAGLPYALVPPSSLKKYASGKGNASKADMRLALFKRAGLDERDDNRVDAWWLRAMALDAYGCPVVDMPRLQAEAALKVGWPHLPKR